MAAAQGKLEISRVIGRVTGTLRAHWLLLATVGVLFILIPEVLAGWFLTATNADDMTDLRVGNLLSATVELVAGLALIHIALDHFAGRTPALGSSLGAAGSAFLGALGINFLTGLGMVLGLILLIVPGVILALGWSVALPWRVANGKGVRAAIKGSWALTKGSRWRILGLAAILVAACLPVAAVYMALAIVAPDEVFIGDVILYPLTVTLFSIVGSVGVAALYNELRHGEGQGTVETAEVFA